jgi:hypothetical protein
MALFALDPGGTFQVSSRKDYTPAYLTDITIPERPDVDAEDRQLLDAAVILVLAVLKLVAPYVISAMRRKPRVGAENV